MYAIRDKESGQWVTAACAKQREWVPGDSHFAIDIKKAATYETRYQATKAKKDLENRFGGHGFAISLLP